MHTIIHTTRPDGTEVWIVAFVMPGSLRSVAVFDNEKDAASYACYLNGGPDPGLSRGHSHPLVPTV